jgi:hypothetical protein
MCISPLDWHERFETIAEEVTTIPEGIERSKETIMMIIISGCLHSGYSNSYVLSYTLRDCLLFLSAQRAFHVDRGMYEEIQSDCWKNMSSWTGIAKSRCSYCALSIYIITTDTVDLPTSRPRTKREQRARAASASDSLLAFRSRPTCGKSTDTVGTPLLRSARQSGIHIQLEF